MSQTEVQLIKSNSVVDGDIVGMSSSKLSGTLPALSAANLTNIPAGNLTGALPAISGANLTGISSAGIAYSYVDEWYLTTNQTTGTGTTNWTSSNLARDTTRYKNGTAMTVDSNGAFTFPATGVYLIRSVQQVIANNTTSRYIGGKIEGTTDNSNYVTFAESVDNMSAISGATYVQTIQEGLFDVENTSTHKVKFGAYSASTVTIQAQTTWIRFIKVQDT
jgi:hypothetical protein|tara:strand:- start:32 stop:691 length:660 start_codon:yes stop_codon:yes gene_type:complete